MKFGLKNIVQGMASIGEGLASFNLFPPPVSPKEFKPLSQQELNKQVSDALASDWEAVGGDLRAAMDRVDAELAAKGINSPRKKS
jgi:hypothetical protein